LKGKAEIEEMTLRLYSEFDALSDYIWKTPKFIDQEIDLERQKLREYFPESEDVAENELRQQLRSIRAAAEGRKLFLDFPRYLAASNLFLSASVFEHHLHLHCKQIENSSSTKISDLRGNGVLRYFAYLRQIGLDVGACVYYEQVCAAVTIRNAMLHANGLLELSRDSAKIKNIVKNRLYRPKSLRLSTEAEAEVSITEAPHRIVVTNNYAHQANHYFRQFLLSISDLKTG
jgi:hypothetical protein